MQRACSAVVPGRLTATPSAPPRLHCARHRAPELAKFDSVEQAIAEHDSPGYQEALAALGNKCERDMRIVEGVG